MDDFWRGRRVFLTGHTGFKGSWLSLWLSHLGAAVTGFSNAVPTTRSLFEDARLDQTLDDRRGDVRDLGAVTAAIREAQPEIVMHLAAQPLVRASYASPVETYATNLMGTVHVMEATRSIGEGCPVLVVTTDKCYENREWVWGYRESEPMGGHDPYSSSKGCAELAASAYARSFRAKPRGFTVATARAGNVIGGGDWAEDRLVPDLIRGLERGETVGIRNPDAIRPWQHVLEPLSGYLLLARRLLDSPRDVEGQGWNFGPQADAVVPVREVADEICSLWGAPRGWACSGSPDQRHEANLLRLDITKADALLGWRPRWDLHRALAESVAVYRSPLRGAELRRLMSDQITAYAGPPHANGSPS